MTATLHGAAMRDDASDAYHRLVAELRDVEHWRRLVAARLDLAVAAVTDIDELPAGAVPGGCPPPVGLRHLLGIPSAQDAVDEAGALVRLRAALAELDAYAATLRPGLTSAARAAGVPRPRMRTQARPRALRAVPTPASGSGATAPERRRARLVPAPRTAGPAS